ncbi:MAG: hypothetical protein C4542_00965 [Dehalococcoidia bacterium]|nr:MAG: hypothetical protein C4542_00965 [Dehalococcoidia bacterium]
MPGELPKNVALAVLVALPLDITYIDERDIIRYYSEYHIFKRTPDILGTTVQNCHKPESRDEVNRVIDDLRSGRKDVSEYPAEKGGRKVRVRYIAIKDDKGKYAGLVEICEWAD